MSDQHYYEIVAQELQQKTLRAGLWTRAVAETGDEGAQARALYIRLRVSELIQLDQTTRAQSQAEAERKADEERREAVATGKAELSKAANALATIVCGILTLFMALIFIASLVACAHEKRLSDSDMILIAIAGGFATFFGMFTYKGLKSGALRN